MVDPVSGRLTRAFFERDPVLCARDLIGAEFRWGRCAGLVVETEAYAEIGDEACHTFFRPSARAFVENHPAGTAYIYLNYGVHWLTNILVKNPVDGNRGFVLLRALEPLSGIDEMRVRRNRERCTDLCSGPGKLSGAFGIVGDHHGASLVGPPDGPGFVAREIRFQIISDRRVGISRSRELRWRFLAEGNPHLSRPAASADQ